MQSDTYYSLRPYLWACLAILIASSPAAWAFDKLTEAQSWVYDRGHLANTDEGQILKYRLVGEGAGENQTQSIEDQASVSVKATHSDGRRDVEIDFLSEDRHIALPPFSGYRGNPIIIAMLEHIAQSMSARSGGGALYFRNRIRDALASEDVELQKKNTRYNNTDILATVLTFYPFVEDQHLAADDILRQASIDIELSDDIPGGVVSVAVTARNDDQVFERLLSLM